MKSIDVVMGDAEFTFLLLSAEGWAFLQLLDWVGTELLQPLGKGGCRMCAAWFSVSQKLKCMESPEGAGALVECSLSCWSGKDEEELWSEDGPFHTSELLFLKAIRKSLPQS